MSEAGQKAEKPKKEAKRREVNAGTQVGVGERATEKATCRASRSATTKSCVRS